MIASPKVTQPLEQPYPEKPDALEMAQRGEAYQNYLKTDKLISEIMEHTGTHGFHLWLHEERGELDKALARSKRISRLLWLYARKNAQRQRFYDKYMEDFVSYLRQGYEYKSRSS